MKDKLPQEKTELEQNFEHVVFIEFKNMDGKLIDTHIIDPDAKGFQEDMNTLIDKMTYSLSVKHQDTIFAFPLSAFRTTKKFR